jgi:hypothetical protein
MKKCTFSDVFNKNVDLDLCFVLSVYLSFITCPITKHAVSEQPP